MKKVLTLLTLLALVFALAGCDSVPGTGGSGNSDSKPTIVTPEDGYAEGRMGDTMDTYFFDFSVNSASIVADYNGYTAAEGYVLLLTELTVKNTNSESIPMYDTDFQAQWNDDAKDAFAYPIETQVGEKQFPAEFDLAVSEERTGEVVFEVPTGSKDFSVSYMELFDDGSEEGEEGDTFFVYFTAEGGSTAA